jgi:hypothetical protein
MSYPTGPVIGTGFAKLTYGTNSGPQKTLGGSATTSIWYDNESGQPVTAYLKIEVGTTICLQFGILPFTGTGSYSRLPYLIFVDAALYKPGVPGVYAVVAYPPAPDPPAPKFTVLQFEPTGHVTAWLAQLDAHLVWWSETASMPPLTLEVSSLTLSISRVEDSGEQVDFDSYAARQFLEMLAEQR